LENYIRVLHLCSSAAPLPAISDRPSPPPAVLHLHASIPSPSAALAPLFWPPARLTRPSPLLPELPPSDSSPSPWQMPASPSFPRPALVAVGSSGSSSSHSFRFPFAVHTQKPERRRRLLLQLRRPPARRGQLTPVHPAPLRPPRKFPLIS
jgi:hypothetical protein